MFNSIRGNVQIYSQERNVSQNQPFYTANIDNGFASLARNKLGPHRNGRN